MATWSGSVTAAVAIVGADLFDGETWGRAPRNRVITEFAMVGSTNPADTKIDLKVEETGIGSFFNTQGGANLVPQKDDIRVLNRYFVPANAQIRAIVTNAAATNAVNFLLSVEDV